MKLPPLNWREPGFYGLLCLIAIAVILLSAISGCAAPQPATLTSFQATCAVVPIGRNEQNITFIKQYCEIE